MTHSMDEAVAAHWRDIARWRVDLAALERAGWADSPAAITIRSWIATVEELIDRCRRGSIHA